MTNDKMSVAMRTALLSEMVTDHSQKIGALRGNQKVDVLEVDIEGDLTVMEVTLSEEGTVQ